MTSRPPCWCPQTMKWRPCWCPDPILRELKAIIMLTFPFVFVEKHGCWSREWNPRIVQNWSFEHYGACSLLVLSWMHQLEMLLIVLHENQWEDTLFQGSPELFPPSVKRRSLGSRLRCLAAWKRKLSNLRPPAILVDELRIIFGSVSVQIGARVHNIFVT